MTQSNHNKQRTGFVDFHCHLDLYPNHTELIQESERLRIRTLTVTNAPSVWPRNHDLISGCRYVRAALGLHPQLVSDRGHEIALFESYAASTKYIGEVGLDGGREFSATFPQQRRLFERILRICAKYGNKVLTVHSRRAASNVLELVTALLPPNRAKVVLHWFTGSKAEASRAVSAGCYFSINYAMTQTKRGRDLIAALPADRIITETDGPFGKYDNRPTMPKDVGVTVSQLATYWGVSRNQAEERILQNLDRLLGGANF